MTRHYSFTKTIFSSNSNTPQPFRSSKVSVNRTSLDLHTNNKSHRRGDNSATNFLLSFVISRSVHNYDFRATAISKTRSLAISRSSAIPKGIKRLSSAAAPPKCTICVSLRQLHKIMEVGANLIFIFHGIAWCALFSIAHSSRRGRPRAKREIRAR